MTNPKEPEKDLSGAKLRMDAYYYGFTTTGVITVDKILSAVACAGKAFHSTEEWGTLCEKESETSKIQTAAIEAAQSYDSLKEQNEKIIKMNIKLRETLCMAYKAYCSNTKYLRLDSESRIERLLEEAKALEKELDSKPVDEH